MTFEEKYGPEPSKEGKARDDFYDHWLWEQRREAWQASAAESEAENAVLRDQNFAMNKTLAESEGLLRRIKPVYDAAIRYHLICEKMRENPSEAVATAEFELSQDFTEACQHHLNPEQEQPSTKPSDVIGTLGSDGYRVIRDEQPEPVCGECGELEWVWKGQCTGETVKVPCPACTKGGE